MDYQTLLMHETVLPYALTARYGIEREGQRITKEGQLVETTYPKTLGNRSSHPYIQTDFAETQMELITPVTDSVEELFRYLAAIHDVAYRSLEEEERLWPLSMPPALPLKDEAITLAKLDRFEDVLYRRYLAKTYGRRKQMVSGIHFNIELSELFLKRMFDVQTEETDFIRFKTNAYLKVTRNYLAHRYLITYLFGASPMSEKNFFVGAAGPKEPVRSLRNSSFGYKNKEDVKVRYDSIETYLEDLTQMVEDGKLSEEKEFYASVRLRGGKKVADLATAGIRYIELRNIDLNPYAEYGISKEQVEFLHLFLLFMLVKEETEETKILKRGDMKNNAIALEHPLHESAYQKEIDALIVAFLTFVDEAQLPLSDALRLWLEEVQHDYTNTLAARWYKEAKQSTQAKEATALAETYAQKAWAKPYQLAGFRDMELSTQILLFDAIQKGINVAVLDEQDQFLQLSVGEHREWVKNANMTAKDSYIVPLLMENKTVTKKVLAQAGFRVPTGGEYDTKERALADFARYKDQGFVVKPKSTNYGLGISIFKEGSTREDFEAALEIAFAEDSSILIEEFLSGTEYRFFVINGQVKAILLRIPANVVGDGKRTITELVAEKNQDPLRGTHHRAPLELIQLGSLEQLMLKEQGYTVDSIPEKETIVYLRENSNISTGGDSIDVTDTFSDDYKQVAIDAVAALGAVICGIDLIIPDKEVPATEKNAYGIIEGNFNPAMHMHTYPFSGTGRRLTMDVLHLLFPEKV